MTLQEMEEMIERCHRMAHSLEHDHEDGLLVSLDLKEIWMVFIGILLGSLSYQCLDDDYAELTKRFGELLEIQKPHWRGEDAAET